MELQRRALPGDSQQRQLQPKSNYVSYFSHNKPRQRGAADTSGRTRRPESDSEADGGRPPRHAAVSKGNRRGF
ncbi:unnamed protein product [Boreogadus saida]